MVDRQDIDALLIGSLYGELSSTEEARLQVHLESHPADRTVLGDLARARHAIQESRILQVQLEPPQSVSALLLQEAARRAPRKAASHEEGWFQRFVRSFVAHPAMAAAAMLVLVVGVAGTMYLRTGDEHLSVGTVQQDDGVTLPSAANQAPAAETASMPTGNDAGAVALDERDRRDHAGSGFGVGLADGEGGNEKNQLAKQQREQQADKPAFAQPAIPKVAKGSPDPETAAEPRPEPKADPKPEAPPAVKLDAAKPKKEALLRRSGPSRALEVGTPQRAPMELDEDSFKQADKTAERPAPRSDSLGATAGSGMTPADSKSAPMTPAPAPGNAAPDSSKGRGLGGGASPPAPPPPPMAVRDPNKAEKEGRQSASQSPSPSKDKAVRPAQVDASASEEAKLSDPGNSELAWARDAHTRVITQVRAGNCADAARLALTLSTRAPAYYEANVQNDRELRNCLSYINAELEREADRERTQRARAAKRTTDEQQQAKPKAAPPKQAAPKQAAPTSK